jgi:hydrogenase nickel incorporation protein HypA/HybF
MHEMSLAEGVLQLIEDAACRDGFNKVSAVWLEIGQLSGVEPDALAFCFDAVTRHTVADGARLEIIPLPGQGWCQACARTVPMTEVFGACPQCGSYPLRVTAGTDMRVKELEVS